ncbi:rhamnosyltransferase [Alteromonas sp. D210916BOD_24]
MLYEPDCEHVKSLTALFCASHWHLVFVDNSHTPLDQALTGNATYFHYKENVGIAEAQNIGLRWLFSRGVEFAFLLDQDSQFTPDVANALLNQFKALAKDQPIAAIGPSIFCQFTQRINQGVVQRGQYHSDDVKLVSQIIASGMLISHQSFAMVGEKESALFIDGVDHEWCWRARKKGLNVYQSLSACMPHRQGDGRVRVWGVTFKQGSPIRLFYQFRNLLVLARRGYVPLYWKFRHICAIPLRYIVNRYYFSDGKKRGAFMRSGLKAGLTNQLGAHPSGSHEKISDS